VLFFPALFEFSDRATAGACVGPEATAAALRFLFRGGTIAAPARQQ
jgi:hypothetical protein